ncbi:unnamed protein product [Dovyalis caffra]|uniref:Late embryogenesis abundant protein LEA-2 subgroup domain-containing protein n=1 Tax=Dovyalis caffra TaxID=77055 RepID=A0AAV1SI43_9ROSI|nr:unnamed protein product [Dovyalis caffra]
MFQIKNYLRLLQIIGLLGLLALCLWLSLRPKEPNFTITEFSLPTSVSNENQSASFKYVLVVKNLDKESSIYYDDILMSFKYKQDMVGNNTIPRFDQGKDKTNNQVIDKVDVNAKVWGALAKAVSNGTAELNVDLSTSIQYKTWHVKSKHHKIKFQGVVPIGSEGKIKGKKKKVKLHGK